MREFKLKEKYEPLIQELIDDFNKSHDHNYIMGPNALYLIEILCERMNLKPGMRVLDMGCGAGFTSIILAKEFGVTVFANDLWFPATENYERFVKAGVDDVVFPTPQLTFSIAKKNTLLSTYALNKYEGTLLGKNIDNGNKNIEKTFDGTWEMFSSKGRWLDNKNRVFVLTDANVLSSGEAFVSWLRTMDNVVFVGSNTHGAKFVANNSIKYLPNSGVYMYFGQDLIANEDVINMDSIGYMPDIWVAPDVALERVIAMCKEYITQQSM